MDDDKPLVSVVIPAYNAEKWVGCAIDSVLCQSYPRVELIVVNDGSSDGTERVCKSYGDKVRYIYQSNAGAAAARNTGIQNARGELVAFLDADDEYLPEMVATLAGALEKYPQCVAASGAIRHDFGGKITRKPSPGLVLRNGNECGVIDFFRTYCLCDCVSAVSVMVRKRVLDAVGGFVVGLKMGEDREMWSRIAGQGPWAYADREVAIYHQCPASSVTFRTRKHVPSIEHVFVEERMRDLIKQEYWESYRLFRRYELLRLARVMYGLNAFGAARAALARIAPAPANLRWIVMRMLLSVPAPLARWLVGMYHKLMKLARAKLRDASKSSGINKSGLGDVS